MVVAKSDHHYQLLFLIDVAVHIDEVQRVVSVDEAGVDYPDPSQVLDRVFEEELMFVVASQNLPVE